LTKASPEPENFNGCEKENALPEKYKPGRTKYNFNGIDISYICKPTNRQII
jgi:hypothetical protein